MVHIERNHCADTDRWLTVDDGSLLGTAEMFKPDLFVGVKKRDRLTC
jgi:hypothetical protein